ncbi:hypothetical protein L1987_01882 [Smallanthus sonchifolius]|uniref:Uncharacterized protein n=1 Tax=Smallanthus sonchifolius TaxID=185202 RepID=A0ACB9K6E0_9ASTR|nr:hypothetical protein L1987_01882 [Smallanthus sonchifolius]
MGAEEEAPKPQERQRTTMAEQRDTLATQRSVAAELRANEVGEQLTLLVLLLDMPPRQATMTAAQMEALINQRVAAAVAALPRNHNAGGPGQNPPVCTYKLFI